MIYRSSDYYKFYKLEKQIVVIMPFILLIICASSLCLPWENARLDLRKFWRPSFFSSYLFLHKNFYTHFYLWFFINSIWRILMNLYRFILRLLLVDHIWICLYFMFIILSYDIFNGNLLDFTSIKDIKNTIPDRCWIFFKYLKIWKEDF